MPARNLDPAKESFPTARIQRSIEKIGVAVVSHHSHKEEILRKAQLALGFEIVFLHTGEHRSGPPNSSFEMDDATAGELRLKLQSPKPH